MRSAPACTFGPAEVVSDRDPALHAPTAAPGRNGAACFSTLAACRAGLGRSPKCTIDLLTSAQPSPITSRSLSDLSLPSHGTKAETCESMEVPRRSFTSKSAFAREQARTRFNRCPKPSLRLFCPRRNHITGRPCTGPAGHTRGNQLLLDRWDEREAPPGFGHGRHCASVMCQKKPRLLVSRHDAAP